MAAVDVQGENVMNSFLQFLNTYADPEQEDEVPEPEKHYVEQLHSMKEYGKTTIFVDFTHVQDVSESLASAILEEYYRFEPFLRKAVQNFVHRHQPGYVMEEGQSKEFYVSFYNHRVLSKLRDMKAELIGRLVAVSGVVTRTSEVRPELLFGTFKCLECGTVHRDVEQQFKYTEPIICSNATCSNRERWVLERHESKFVDWQRVRLQESTDQVPAGSLPRSLDVILRHEIVEQARAGDKCIFTGTLIVVPDVGALARSGDLRETSRNEGGDNSGARGGPRGAGGGEGVRGLKALGCRDLSYRLAFLATSVQSMDKEKQLVNIRAEDDEGTVQETYSAEEMEELMRIKETGNVYDRLTESIAPSVFGHADVKRAILLMLFGGCHKRTHEGINLRGDINVCIVGDPSCAKSQFLKYVASFLPRAVYTSGKSSSAAGLTASVVKEPETGEFCIEAGALMLADNGICCIDEFDKMDIKDQVAIHEAMEQQTISIAKAGIQATLNARTSILAAANPAAGRYDKSKPLKYNVAMPPAILSRFDLVHVMIDEPDDALDGAIARHIVAIHQKKDEAVQPELTTLQLQKYIKYARTIKPQFSPAARERLVEAYVALRKGDAAPGSRTSYRITVRQLEALIRLSEALARVYCEHEVQPRHVNEAKSLLSTSIISVDSRDFELDDEGAPDDLGDLPGAPPGKTRDDTGNGNDESGPQDDILTSTDRLFTDSMDDTPLETESTPGKGRPSDSMPSADGRKASGPSAEAAEQGDHQQEEEKDVTATKPADRGKVQVSYDKFQQVMQALVGQLRDWEASQEADGGSPGMKQGDLVRWFVSRRNEEGLFASIDEVVQEYRLVRSIIQHLIRREGILIVLDDDEEAVAAARAAAELAQASGEVTPGATQRIPSAVEERVLAVNPNYVQE